MSTRTFALRVPASRILLRPYSTLRSQKGPGPRKTFQRQKQPGIPVNASRGSQALQASLSQDSSSSSSSSSSFNGEQPHNSLLTPIVVPKGTGALTESHPAAKILENSALVVQRQFELGNVLLGFEQANKYVLMDPNGAHVGFMAEEESGIAKIIARQWFRTHRAFTTHVFDRDGIEVLKFHRPFSFINSRIRVYDPVEPSSISSTPASLPANEYRTIGEVQQQWHLLRRKYNLFLRDQGTPADADESFVQWAYVNEPFLSWDFSLLTEKDELVGSINRDFSGFARELFTDTGVYVLRMDAASTTAEPNHLISRTQQDRTYRPSEPHAEGIGNVAGGRGMTLDERAVLLAAAVTVDFDYFSRHSGHHSGLMPFGFGGGEHNAGEVGNTSNTGADVAAGGMMGGMMGGSMGRSDSQEELYDERRPSETPSESWWEQPGGGGNSGTDGGTNGGGGGDGVDFFDF